MIAQSHFYVAICPACGRQVEAVRDRVEFERTIRRKMRSWGALGYRVRPMALAELNLKPHGDACPQAGRRG